MANKRTVGIVLLVAGVVLLIVSLGADVIGIGESGRFGVRQILGTAAGILLIVVGFLYPRR